MRASALALTVKRYYLPPPQPTGLQGDVAISSTAGPVWPMKKWAYYDELKNELESEGLKVNVLRNRPYFARASGRCAGPSLSGFWR